MAEGALGGVELGTMVSKLLSEPELISKIAQTIGVGEVKKDGGGDGGTDGGSGGESTSATADVSLLELLGTGGERRELAGECSRVALLGALKPFCNSHRRRTIDYMISISRLSDTLRGAGGGG